MLESFPLVAPRLHHGVRDGRVSERYRKAQRRSYRSVVAITDLFMTESNSFPFDCVPCLGSARYCTRALSLVGRASRPVCSLLTRHNT